MKKIIVLFMLVMVTISVHAQFSISNSTQRRVIVAYELGSDGYYKRVTKKSVSVLTILWVAMHMTRKLKTCMS